MSGPGDEYSDDEVDEVFDAFSDALIAAYGDGGGGARSARITVTARVEWAGEYANNGNDGMRTVRMDPIDITAARAAVARAQELQGLALRGPLSSYKAKGARTQYQQLQRTKAGRAALEEAGVGGNRRTRAAWIAGARSPNRANQRKIAEAYENVRNPGRGWLAARRAAVDALTDAMRSLPGSSTVRFRDISDMRIE